MDNTLIRCFQFHTLHCTSGNAWNSCCDHDGAIKALHCLIFKDRAENYYHILMYCFKLVQSSKTPFPLKMSTFETLIHLLSSWQVVQSQVLAFTSTNITKPCECLTCVKTCEKRSQASPAKLLKSVEYSLRLVEVGTDMRLCGVHRHSYLW